MRRKTKITLLKSGNRLVVDPTPPAVHDLLIPHLTFEEKKFHQGREAFLAKQANKLPFETIMWECYGIDSNGRLAAAFGFHRKITLVLKKAGYDVTMRDTDPPKDMTIFEPQWDRLKEFDITLRHSQDEFLLKFFSNRCGRFDCPPAYGKSTMIGLIGILLPRAKIDVVSKRVPVVRERIYPELCSMLPSVGIVGGGMHKTGKRIMCYTSGSIQHAPGDADILIGDEVHELVSDAAAGKFAAWSNSRNFGLSASHDMRLDNKDMRAEAIFGPIIFRMGYKEACKHNMVVPIEVHWRDVYADFDPCEGCDITTQKKRNGIWRHDYRNELIAADANLYDDKTQVLITCETLEHALHLKKLLPNFTLVYNASSMTPAKRKRYIRRKFIKKTEPVMTSQRQQELTKEFEAGTLKKVICTTVWNAGVNFRSLGVLIRADAGGSPVNDTQIPGRVSRTIGGKTVGIVHDYLDQFNRGFSMKAAKRKASYVSHGWTQIAPGKAKPGSFRQRMLWSDNPS